MRVCEAILSRRLTPSSSTRRLSRHTGGKCSPQSARCWPCSRTGPATARGTVREAYIPNYMRRPRKSKTHGICNEITNLPHRPRNPLRLPKRRRQGRRPPRRLRPARRAAREARLRRALPHGGQGDAVGVVPLSFYMCTRWGHPAIRPSIHRSGPSQIHPSHEPRSLAPLPGAENNNKPGVKLPATLMVGGARVPITILEAVLKQTGVYAPMRKGRLSVFWGDQVRWLLLWVGR